MNVYEEAHNLARAIKESNEFIEFDNIRKEVEADESLNGMLQDLMEQQVQLQAQQMTGAEMDPARMSQMQSLYAMLATNPRAATYLQAQARFSIMMKDVTEILADAVNIKNML